MAEARLSELRTSSDAELRQRLASAREELTAARLKAHQGTVEQPHRIRMMRRHIARLLTILSERAHRETKATP